jgi:hypothetical protein
MHHQWKNLAPSCGRLWSYQYTRPATHIMTVWQCNSGTQRVWRLVAHSHEVS